MFQPLIQKIETPSSYLWLIDINHIEEEEFLLLIRQLDPDSIQRYSTFLKQERKHQFLISRILLKQAIASFLELSTAKIGIIEQKYFLPQLKLGNKNIPLPYFSISHSRNWVACAISNNGNPLGLDIEVIDPKRKIMKLGALAFHPEKYDWVQSQPENEQVNAFYQIWTQKEALYKLLSVQQKTNRPNKNKINNCLNKNNYDWYIHRSHPKKLSIALCGQSSYFF